MYRTVQPHLLGSSNFLSQFTHRQRHVDSAANLGIIIVFLSFESCLNFPTHPVWQGWHVDVACGFKAQLDEPSLYLDWTDVTAVLYRYCCLYSFNININVVIFKYLIKTLLQPADCASRQWSPSPLTNNSKTMNVYSDSMSPVTKVSPITAPAETYYPTWPPTLSPFLDSLPT
jgi:hypothetical protein